MFFLLRKLVILAFLAALLGVGIVAYQNRHVLSPVADLCRAVMIRLDGPSRELESLSGQVTRISGDHAVQLKSENDTVYNFQLTGFEPIDATEGTEAAKKKLRDECRTHLSQLVLSNQVRVEATYLREQRTGLGLVYVGDTNVNATLVESGLARMNRNYLKGLPVVPLYEMLRAERMAKQHKRGVWND